MLVLLILAALFAAVVVLHLAGLDGSRYTAALLALTPYCLVAGVAVGVIGLAVGDWQVGAGTLVLAGVLGSRVVPRARVTPAAVGAGPRLRILASNLFVGRGDVKTVIELVREHRIDVLNLLELTDESAEEFERAGLFDLLPYRIIRPLDGGRGSGLAARHPLTELALAGPSSLEQPSARLEIDGVAVEVVAVHPVPPTDSAGRWRNETAGLPGPGDAIRVLAGDYNATLDHATFRRLLRAGYRDAAEQRGKGLVPTWPSKAPLVTLDHVLADQRASIIDYRTFRVPGSDHLAVYAELELTSSGGTAG